MRTGLVAEQAMSEKRGTQGTHLGLVCQTASPEVRYRTVTRARLLKMCEADQLQTLRQLYRDNLDRLLGAVRYCFRSHLHLYRIPTALFRLCDEPAGRRVLEEMREELAHVGPLAKKLKVRIVDHPDQFVVLNSVSPGVAATSRYLLEREAMLLDTLGLPATSWTTLILHGGKSGRSEELIRAIEELPANVRDRLALENDEYAYSAGEILVICRRTGVPMVFDAHHHAVKEKLTSYDDPSVAELTAAARSTWHPAGWQLVHLSNGRSRFADPRHAELITQVPAAFRHVAWLEVEAKGKEQAIAELRKVWPETR